MTRPAQCTLKQRNALLGLIWCKRKGSRCFSKSRLSWQICLIFLPNRKKCIWPVILTAFPFGSCLYCANVCHFKDGWAVNFVVFFTKKLKFLNNAQYKHETTMRAVRVNGQITEVKQPRPWLILRWVTIWHPHFLSLAEILPGIHVI